MRRVRAGLFVLLCALGAAACGGSSTATTQPSGGSPGMKATIDGSSWTATAVQAFHEGSIISVGGAVVGGFSIGLAFADSAGTYNIGPTGPEATASVMLGSTTWIASVAEGSGTITVSALDAKHVAGTFSFVAPAFPTAATPATRTVTSGTFNVNF